MVHSQNGDYVGSAEKYAYSLHYEPANMQIVRSLDASFAIIRLSSRCCHQLIKSGRKFKRVPQIKRSIQMKSTCLPAPPTQGKPRITCTCEKQHTHAHLDALIAAWNHRRTHTTCLISITCSRPKTSFVTGRFVSAAVRKRLFLSSKIYRYRHAAVPRNGFRDRIAALPAGQSSHCKCVSENKRDVLDICTDSAFC